MTTTMTRLNRCNTPDLTGDTQHKYILDTDATREWHARHVTVQAPPIDVGPVQVYARRGTHPAHLATALRALADLVEAEGLPELDPSP